MRLCGEMVHVTAFNSLTHTGLRENVRLEKRQEEGRGVELIRQSRQRKQSKNSKLEAQLSFHRNSKETRWNGSEMTVEKKEKFMK